MKEKLTIGLGDKLAGCTEAHGELNVTVLPENLLAAAQLLRDQDKLSFTFLSDLTGIDCGGEELEVVYHLLSIKHRSRVRIKVRIPRGTAVPSVTGIWPTANWHEREAYDLLGITFAGHPDLKRILTPDGFSGHPLLKEFPLRGEK
jgi:NADH-quinone oxidoreductase subunit C